MNDQLSLFDTTLYLRGEAKPFTKQLLKWIGNKQRFAHEIIADFPQTFGTYYEPFIGSGAVLGTLHPDQAVAGDVLQPLIDLWLAVRDNPQLVVHWYSERLAQMQETRKEIAYERIKAAYNANPNAADFLFLSRSCYGGVMRFRKDGYISTPCGVHDPISTESFAERVYMWSMRIANTAFICADFAQVMQSARKGDLIYCDPPYSDTQAILYGAQAFSLSRLMDIIAECKQRGVYVALSIDGTKKTGMRQTTLAIPNGLFAREMVVNCGRSMLKRFQMEGHTLENEVVTDRLLLTY